MNTSQFKEKNEKSEENTRGLFQKYYKKTMIFNEIQDIAYIYS